MGESYLWLRRSLANFGYEKAGNQSVIAGERCGV
jgi:hypothetical protein